MSRFIIPLLILLALASAAHAIGLGEGNRFGRMGSFKTKAGAGPPPPTCTINGSLNFSGTSSCNMIFYVTGVIQ